MAKNKTQSKPKAKQKTTLKQKQEQKQKRSDGSAEISRAESRLNKALADVDRARERVIRREHDLSALMAKHGRVSTSTSEHEDGHGVAAALQSASENGNDQSSTEAADAVPVELVPASDGDEHHG